jgi:branched-chain amino acid transport system substrate-binding protein
MKIIHRVRRFFAGQRMLGISLVVIVGVALYVFVFRTQYYQSNAVLRSAGANAWLERGFTVAIVWPPHSSVSLVEGVQLAFDEIQPSSPLYGKMQLKFFTETDDGGALARQIAGVPDILAVIGHEFDGPTIPASITYEDHGMLFIAPKSTDKRLTQHEFRYTFRLTPEDEDMTKALANFAVSKGWTRVGTLYGRVDHGESATRQFLTATGNVGIAIPFMRSFFHEPRWQAQDFRPMIGTIRSQQFDALMLADQLPWAAKLLMDMVTMGVSQPVIATDKLDSMQVWQLAGKAANNLYVASSVDPESTEPRYRAFRERFKAKFGVEPGYGSSQGYEAMSLLIAAIEKSGSADPVVIATTMRTNPWAGLFGQVTFSESGDVVGRTISVKRMFEGAFTTVSSVKIVREEVK